MKVSPAMDWNKIFPEADVFDPKIQRAQSKRGRTGVYKDAYDGLSGVRFNFRKTVPKIK